MKTAVIGSGAWGTALALCLHKNGHQVTLWTFEKEIVEQMRTTRKNPRLPQVTLPEEITRIMPTGPIAQQILFALINYGQTLGH